MGYYPSRSILFKPSLPVMFILSAIAGGVSLTLLVTLITERIRQRELISRVVCKDIARFIVFTLLAYLYLKLWDWAATSYYSHPSGTADVLQRLELTTPFNQSFWVLEVLLGIVVPAFILLSPGLRRTNFARIDRKNIYIANYNEAIQGQTLTRYCRTTFEANTQDIITQIHSQGSSCIASPITAN